jgi:cyanophycin synthetase
MLTIRRTRVFHGPGAWAPLPAVVMEVDIGELEERLGRETPVFFEHLIALIPSLADQSEVVRQPEGGLRRLLLDHLALALQQLARAQVDVTQWNRPVGPELTYAQTQPMNVFGRYRVVYEYEHEEVGLAAGTLAVRLLNHLLVRSEPDFDFTRELETTLVPLAKQHAYPWTTGAILEAAHRRGIPALSRGREVGVQLGTGVYQRLIADAITSETPWLGVMFTRNTGLTYRLLREAGLPVPSASIVRSASGAVKAGERLHYPAVVKPLDAGQWRGVTIDVRDEAEVREAFRLAQGESRSGQVLVERFIPSKTYRILVVARRVVAVLERLPAHVIGDGTHTIAQLIAITNADPRRGSHLDSPLQPITIDAQTHTVLTKQVLALEDVPDAGRVVRLKPFSGLKFGGTEIDRTDEIHPENAAIALQAARVVGLDVAGIDVITPDIAHSVHEQSGAIIAVNSQPDLRGHIHPTEGQSRDVGMAIIDMLFPPGQPVRVPIVAITGTVGKTTTTRMIAHIMTTAGKTVGMTTTSGIYIDGTRIAVIEASGPNSARKVLSNPAVDSAVLEAAMGGIRRDGLGFRQCDVGVVTNVTDDHLGGGEFKTLTEVAQLKSTMPRAVMSSGASVLNADNPYTVEMAGAAGGEILFFSLDEANPVIRDHLRQGGRAVVLRQTVAGETLSLLAGEEETDLLLAAEIPATMDGRIRVNIANALTATAAAIAQQVPLETIRTALCTFTSSSAQSPGRFNLLQIDGRTVVYDYFRNLPGLEAVADFVTRMGAPHTVAAIAMAGGGTDENITAYGQLAARTFDELVIRDSSPESQGRRQPGEVAALLQAAAIASGFTPDKITLAHDEETAVDIAIARSRNGSLVLVQAGALANHDAIWNYPTHKQHSHGTT